MGEETTHTTGTCERALDYVYGELDEAQKRAFEEHLPGCARCQAEVASLGRARTAARRVLPAVEPPAALGGALHAQLMHAAAQRKPRRGLLLSFPRKIVEHPALSAAAMFVIVGGAIAINWSHGRLAMPVADQSETAAPAVPDAPKPTESAKLAEGAAEAPAAEPVPLAKSKEGDKAANVVFKGEAANKPLPQEDATKIALETPAGSYRVQPSAHRAAVAAAAPAKKPAPARLKKLAVDGKYDSSLDDRFAAKDEETGGPNGLGSVTRGGVVGGGLGATSGGGGRAAANENAKSSAPAELARKSVAEKQTATGATTPSHGYASGGPATMTPRPTSASSEQAWRNRAPAAPPAATSAPPPSAPASARDSGYFARPQAQAAPPAAVQKPAANARNFDVMRKLAVEDAKTGRCEEALKLYQELDQANQHLSPGERVGWVHCLAERGRQEEAQQRLDELKQEKHVTNAEIQNAERELDDSKRRVEGKKAKRAPAPADRAPAAAAAEQRRAEPPPAQSPPDSTNTKVKRSPPAY